VREPHRRARRVEARRAARAVLKAQPRKTMTIPAPILNLPTEPEVEPDADR
jgi:hypothetical protein